MSILVPYNELNEEDKIIGEAVFVGTLGMAISMGAIVVVAALAGILCYVIENRIDHSEHH